ncbi:MAG: hypothetical protein ABI779_14075 [Acidobacteriota bacterium]
MTIKEDNLRAVDHYYLTARERRARRFLDTASPAKRARTLESHLLREPSKKAQGVRHEVDYLLRYYSLLELASITGAIPVLPAATREIALRNLNDEYLRRYYEQYYTQLLPQLFRARLSGDRALTADDDCTEDFLRFVALDASRDDDDIEAFLGFLDHYIYVIDDETHDLSSVVRTIANPKRFLAALSVVDDNRTPTDEGVVGLLRFLSFSRDLDDFLRHVDSALVRSCFWHYYSYWYQELGGQVLGALLTGIHILGAYVPPSAANAAEARALARTHADMAAAVASLQRLTSSVYRVCLEEVVYGGLQLHTKNADVELAEAQTVPAKEVATEEDEVREPQEDDDEHVPAPPQSVYRVQFVGLVCFVRRPGERYVLLPDGRNPGYGIDPYFATIHIAPDDICDVSGWDHQTDISRGVFQLPPCSLAIQGADEPGVLDTSRHDGHLPELRQIDPAFAIDPSRADTIAKLHIRRGTLTAYQVPGGTAIMSQLEFSNGGSIMIAVSPSDESAVRTITLRSGAEIAIANISTPRYARAMANGTEEDSFRVYERLGALPVSLSAPRYVADVPVSPSRHALFSARAGSSTNVSNTSFG